MPLETQKTEGYTVSIAKSLSEVETLREIWESLQRHPNSDIDFYKTVIEFGEGIQRPHAILIRRDDGHAAIVAGRIESLRLPFRFGYKRITEILVRSLTVVYGGVLGTPSPEDTRLLFSEFDRALEEDEADMIFFSHLNPESAVYRHAMSDAQLHRVVGILNRHWRMTVPKTVEELFCRWGRKPRHHFRNAANKLAKTFDGQVAFRCFQDENDIEVFLCHAEQIARKTYQRALGVGFRDDELNQSLIRLAGKRGWLHSHILYIQEHPASFQAGIHYGDTLYIDNIGYDPDYRNLHPGKNLFLKVAATLCSRADIRYVDFGFGHSRYKQSLCDQFWDESSLYLFPQTVQGASARALVAGDLFVARLLGGLMDGTRLQERIKTIWREHLTDQSEYEQRGP